MTTIEKERLAVQRRLRVQKIEMRRQKELAELRERIVLVIIGILLVLSVSAFVAIEIKAQQNFNAYEMESRNYIIPEDLE